MKKLYFYLVLMVVVTTSFSFVDSNLPQDGNKFFYWIFTMLYLVGIVHLIKKVWEGYLVIKRVSIISRFRKIRIQREEDQKREKFFFPSSIQLRQKLIALILLLPFLASAQGIIKNYVLNPDYWQQFWNDHPITLIVLVITSTISGFAILERFTRPKQKAKSEDL